MASLIIMIMMNNFDDDFGIIYDDFDHGDDLSINQSIRRRGAGLQNTGESELVPGKIFEYLSEKYPELIPKGKNLPKHAHLGKSKETGVSFDTIIRFSRLELFIIINDYNDIDFDH